MSKLLLLPLFAFVLAKQGCAGAVLKDREVQVVENYCGMANAECGIK
jgi:hypothetical protein